METRCELKYRWLQIAETNHSNRIEMLEYKPSLIALVVLLQNEAIDHKSPITVWENAEPHIDLTERTRSLETGVIDHKTRTMAIKNLTQNITRIDDLNM